MKSVPFLLPIVLLLAACDQADTSNTPAATPGSTGGNTSSYDGRPIIHLTASQFGSGDYVRQIRDDLAARGLAVAEVAGARAARSAGAPGELAPVLLKDLYAQIGSQARGGTAAPAPSTHLAVEFRDGYVEGRLLTLEVEPGAAAAARGGGTGGIYVVGDPDIDAASDGQATYQKEGVSLADATDTRTVTFDHGAYSVEGDPDAQIVILGSLAIIDGDNVPESLMPPPCNTGINKSAGCGGSSGGGTHTGGGTSTGGGPSGPLTFEAHMLSSSYLALRTLRTNTHGDHGPNLEVQMHIQTGDNYTSLQFRKANDYRFDTSIWANVFTTGLGGLFERNYRVFGPPGGPARGTANAWNAVVMAQQNQSRWYLTPDVNRDNTDYNFTGMTVRKWDFDVSDTGDPYTSLGYIPQPAEDGFPLHALTTTPMRAVMVEDDQDLRYFTKRADGDWEGTVNTFDFQNGGYSSVYTEIDADWFSVADDDVFDQSGYRRATLDNVSNRAGGDGFIRTDSNGFKYTFQVRSF